MATKDKHVFTVDCDEAQIDGSSKCTICGKARSDKLHENSGYDLSHMGGVFELPHELVGENEFVYVIKSGFDIQPGCGSPHIVCDDAVMRGGYGKKYSECCSVSYEEGCTFQCRALSFLHHAPSMTQALAMVKQQVKESIPEGFTLGVVRQLVQCSITKIRGVVNPEFEVGCLCHIYKRRVGDER